MLGLVPEGFFMADEENKKGRWRKLAKTAGTGALIGATAYMAMDEVLRKPVPPIAKREFRESVVPQERYPELRKMLTEVAEGVAERYAVGSAYESARNTLQSALAL